MIALIATSEEDAARWLREFPDAPMDRVIYLQQGARQLDGLRVSGAYATPASLHHPSYFYAQAAVRRSVTLLKLPRRVA